MTKTIQFIYVCRLANFWLSIATTVFVAYLFIVIAGCGGNGEDPAILTGTTPAENSKMRADDELSILFDKPVAEVKVNGKKANVDGTTAIWSCEGLEPGEQKLRIEWIDVNGNTGTQELAITIDNTPPEVFEINVAKTNTAIDGKTKVDPAELNDDEKGGILITFSEPIDVDKSRSVFILASEWHDISWDTKWNSNRTQVILTPGVSYGCKYTLTIKDYFDEAGNEGREIAIEFYTKDPYEGWVPIGPTRAKGIVLWLRLDDKTWTLERGLDKYILAWEDAAGKGGMIAAALGADTQPVLVENAINGKRALNFDGEDDFLKFIKYARIPSLPPPDYLSNMTVFLVSVASRNIAPSGQHAAISWSDGMVYLTPSRISGEVIITTAVIDSTTDRRYINGDLVSTEQRQAAPSVYWWSGCLGKGYDDTYFPGMIAEVLVYKEALSDVDRQDIEKYLNKKYLIY